MTETGLEFRALYREHAPTVRRLLARLLPASEVDDGVQEVFLRIYRHRQKFRGEALLTTWIYQITVHCAHDLYRRQRWRRWLQLGASYTEERPHTEDAKGQEEAERVHKAMQQLSFQDRTILALFYWEEFRLEEISKSLDIPLGTAKSRLSLARKRLKVYLKEDSP